MLSIVASIMDVLGLSSKLNFDSKYMMQMKNEDFSFYGYKQRSNIIFDKTTGNWKIIELLHSNKTAITNASLSPLGTRNFLLSQDLGGGHISLDINACDDRTQFNCQEGSCIPIEKRCNSEFDCKYGDDEIECNLIDIPHTYLSFVPGITSSYFKSHNA